MELFLDLKSIPTFLSCDYFAGADAAHVICGSPDEDRIVFAVRGSLKSDGFTLQAGRYYILRAGEGIRFTGVDPEYFVVSFFGTFEFTESVGQPLPVSGRFDYKSVTRYWNRLLEIRDQCIAGQSVSFIEQQGLFCMILGELYSYRYTPASEYLAKAIMDEVVEHYTSGFSLEKLSRTYFYSANYIIRVFCARVKCF